MTKSYYSKGDGFFYTAMCTAEAPRKMDLPKARVVQREKAGRIFYPGWVEGLERLNIIVRIQYIHEKFLWLVDSEAAAHVLGCRPNSVLKYLEIMRYIRFVPKELETLPEAYGYMRCPVRQPTSPHQILDVVDFSDNHHHHHQRSPVIVSSFEEEEEIDIIAFIDSLPKINDVMYELPPILMDITIEEVYYW